MRKYQQKQLLELIQTLNEANAEIERLFSRADFDSVMQLLADCQSVAVQMGEFIEVLEGEGTNTVTLLEQYHDDLYSAGVEIGDGAVKPNFTKHLRRKIIAIETGIKTELKPNEIEVVFFPYKASMWDSLESVWLAALNDPQCDAFVVPIPYYEKINQKDFGKMHYEGELYPDYVPIVDWREYDAEVRNPDVVYIHYAYDDMTQNYSVHPNFFSKRLKECCETLVYIPYYVQATNDVPEYNGYLPGIVNADYVIVQSQGVRQAYIEQYSKYYNAHKNAEQLKNPEEKFVALGSPKFDKVFSSEKEDFELPEDWKRLIYKPDGTAKKIILYNNHMFAWIDGGEQYFKKLLSVFEMFSKREDVVLWWRPHPSTEQNFRALRPQMLEAYYSTVEAYRRAGFGIYDDTPELHRAIAWTDAYYGDGSSLVAMVQAAGKAVMYAESPLYNNNAITYKAAFSNSVMSFVTVNANLYASVNLENGEIVPIEFLGEADKLFEYYSTYETQDKTFFSPYNASIIAVFNKTAIMLTYIPLEKYKGSAEPPYFGQIVQYKNSLYFIPINFPGILEIDIDTEDITVHTGWEKDVKAIAFENDENGSIRGIPCIIDNRLMVACESANAVLEFDMDTGRWQIINIGKENISYLNVCNDGDTLWLLGRNKPVLVKKNKDSISTVDLSKYAGNEKTNYYIWCFTKGEFLWLIPCTAEKILKINKTTCEIVKDDYFAEYMQKASGMSHKFTFAGIHQDKIWLVPYIGKGLLSIGIEDDFEDSLKMSLSKSVGIDDFKPYISKSTLFVEGNIFSLDMFIESIICDCIYKPSENKTDSNVGKRIYEYFCRN